jgi:FkbM family methyltransferase
VFQQVQQAAVKYATRLLKITTGSQARRKELLRRHAIEVVVDVGANEGQYALELRSLGFQGEIHSFEPLRQAYDAMQRSARDDPRWFTHNVALGRETAKRDLHVTSDSWSSSFRQVGDLLEEVAPEGSVIVDNQSVVVKTLDSVAQLLAVDNRSLLLKIDTQGWEKEVLEGGQAFLNQVDLVQLEMSLAALYDDEPLFTEMHTYMHSRGFRLVGIEPGVTSPSTGHLLQFDALYTNSSH